MNTREWKTIEGYEGLYEVSNDGCVRSLDRMVTFNDKGSMCTSLRRGKMMSPFTDKSGYKGVSLYKEGRGKHFLVHRLVAMAFIPNENCLPEVNHKDENKSNNCVDNLEWCTSQYNGAYGLRPNKYKKAVAQCDAEGNVLRVFRSVTEAAKAMGCHYTCISHALRDRTKLKGYYFTYDIR